jgi:4-hydroxybenzoate polyprenyltransferase
MAKRSRPRSYLLLARVSNLPTVWTNVLAAYVVAGAALYSMPMAALAMTVFYTAGMFLNDASDADIDAVQRPERPIPAGDVSRLEALVAGLGMLAGGEWILKELPQRWPALMWGAALAAAIVAYDYKHKGQTFAPVVMGLCRALIYCTVAAGATGTIAVPVAIAAIVMWVYIIALTWIAKTPGLGYLVPHLLAGICIVDAVMIAVAGEPRLALVAASGFLLTLAFQRVIPGT